jgi:glycosyltransferase involved in cell wall biosynthesis
VNIDPARPNGWLIPPDDQGSLEDAMVEAVNRPDERAARGTSGLKLAREKYAWTSLAERTAAVYEEALSASR